MENTRLLKDNLLTIARGNFIKLVFSDWGTGIHRANINRIFDP